MRAHVLVALAAAGVVGIGCRGAQRGGDASAAEASVRDNGGGDLAADASTAQSPCATRPLTAADVEQYASVMHAAVDRWHDLPADDRAALAAAKSLESQGSNPDPATMATMADKLQRAAELKSSMDHVVARERHIPLDCYDAIAGRIETVAPDMTTLASGDAADDGASAGGDPAKRQAALAREHADSVVVAPRRAELQPLIHEVRMGHLAE
jgi:hypothetical protein